mgnify:FL=1
MSDRLPVLKTYKLYIGGKFPRTESGRYFPLRTKTGDLVANVSLASRKDLRQAVQAARAATGAWAKATPFLRGQILYRLSEMLEDRQEQIVRELTATGEVSTKTAQEEVRTGIDRIVYYAGWTDKFQQIAATVNPVSSPHFNFSVPEPIGVVGVVCPPAQGFLGLLSALLPVIAGGNTAVVIASGPSPLCAISLAEALATSDLPAGVVNMLTGDRSELLPHLKVHMDVNALSVWDSSTEEQCEVRSLDEDNLKRFVFSTSGAAAGPQPMLAFQEIKTTWHPIGL